MLELNEKTNFDDLTYHYKNRQMGAKIFHDLDNAVKCFKSIRDGNITLEKAKKKKEFKLDLNEIKRERYNSDE